MTSEEPRPGDFSAGDDPVTVFTRLATQTAKSLTHVVSSFCCQARTIPELVIVSRARLDRLVAVAEAANAFVDAPDEICVQTIAASSALGDAVEKLYPTD